MVPFTPNLWLGVKGTEKGYLGKGQAMSKPKKENQKIGR